MRNIKYASDNDIVFNDKKSVCIVFKPDRYKLKSPDIVLYGAKLEYVENAKYLGVIINEKCKTIMIYNDIFAAYTHVPILSFANSITVLLILNYLCLNPIVYPLIVHIYGYVIISILTPNFELLLTMYTGAFSVLENVIVLVRCMSAIILITLMLLCEKNCMVLCKECAISIIL